MNEIKVWPEISEAKAEGDTAGLYEEIRRVTGIPLVNLIYRHIATITGGLPWAWTMLRPLYESNALAELGADLLQNTPLPSLPGIPEVLFAPAGLGRSDLDDIANILDFYIRGNTMNLLAMSVLCRILDESGIPQMAAPLSTGLPGLKSSGQTIRPILPLDVLNENTRALVTHLNKLGEGSTPDSVSPSLFRHLAHWPAFLCLAGVYLLPLEVDGSLEAGAKSIRERALSASAIAVKNLQPGSSAELAPAASVAIRAASGHFADVTIPRLLPICLLLRRALPPSIP